MLRTQHRAFAEAVRRAQRRRPGGGAPGSGQLGDDCGRCRRMLIRYEQGRRGGPDLRYECASCGSVVSCSTEQNTPRSRQRR